MSEQPVDTLEKLEATAQYFTNVMDKLEELRARAIELDRMDLLVDINTTLKGLFGIVAFVSEQHTQLLEMMGAVKVSVTNLDEPHLTLVVDNTKP